jgi:sarcosine oxidase
VHDVIVVGLGGMGSSAAYHLAARGQRVLGLERFGPGHDQGASHGGSRITRQSYFEDPAYVPLLLRAYELWSALEHDSGRNLMDLCGGLMLGAPDSVTVAGSRRSAERWDLPHEMLDAAEIRRRFPNLTPQPHEIALYERNAGLVRPEETVLAHLSLAGNWARSSAGLAGAGTRWSRSRAAGLAGTMVLRSDIPPGNMYSSQEYCCGGAWVRRVGGGVSHGGWWPGWPVTGLRS